MKAAKLKYKVTAGGRQASPMSKKKVKNEIISRSMPHTSCHGAGLKTAYDHHWQQ